jgi:hypothetical protein
MKIFKLIDTWTSMALIFIFLVLSVAWGGTTLLTGYFVVGGWQVISMIVHAVNGWFCYEGGKRLVYHWVVAITIMVALLGFLVYPLLYFVLLALLFAAPFMAIYYTMICYEEVYVKMRRPLDLLK